MLLRKLRTCWYCQKYASGLLGKFGTRVYVAMDSKAHESMLLG